jgi:hypothetical protein
LEQMPTKKSVYNKERHEQNKEEILKYRHERYRKKHKKDLNIKVSTGTLLRVWIKPFFCLYNTMLYVIIGSRIVFNVMN